MVGNGLDRSAAPNSDCPENAMEWDCYLGVGTVSSSRFRPFINGTVKTVPYSMFIPYIFLISAVICLLMILNYELKKLGYIVLTFIAALML